jgi:glycosyltransferase involved in cell wall biosynthesis
MSNKVLHIRSTIGMYGAEQVVFNITGMAEKCSFDTSVLIIEGTNKEANGLRNNLTSINAQFNHIVSSKRFDLNVINEIKEKCEGVLIVHTHDYKSLILASISLLFKSTKIIHHIHGALGNTRSERIYSYLERVFMLNASKIITVSNVQKSIIKNRIGLKNKVIQIDNGTTIYESKRKGSNQNDNFLMVMAARFTPEKDHKKAIDIVSLLRDQNYSVELVLLGDGPELGSIKHYAKERGVEGSIKFVGFTADVKKWLDESHLMLITSITEGLPMSMLEAMSSGLPIVSTPVGEIPNILKKSKGGWTAESTIELSSKIIHLINNRSILEVAGNDAHNFSKANLSTEKQVIRIEAIYRDIIGGNYEH